MEKIKNNPVYVHTCNDCAYMGKHVEAGVLYDLYYCKVDHKYDTVYARFGNNPVDFISTHDMSKVSIEEPLWHARHRARSLRYV
jgi:hypothetical protein